MKKRRKKWKKNRPDIAKDLRTPKYKMKVLTDKKAKARSRKHKKGCTCLDCTPLNRPGE